MRLFISAIFFLATTVQAAPFLDWQYPDDVSHDGFRLYCGNAPATNPDPVVVAPELRSYDAADLPRDVEQECWLTAFRGTETSDESDHLSFTIDSPVVLLPPVDVHMSGTVLVWSPNPESAMPDFYRVNCGGGNVRRDDAYYNLVHLASGESATCYVRSVIGEVSSNASESITFVRLAAPSTLVIRAE